MILPVDQGFEHGPARSFAPNPPAYDPHYHFQLAIDAGLSAYAAPLGMIEAGADTFAGAIPTILKLNSANSLSDQQGPGGHRLGRSDALRLGCAAIGFTIYPGSEDQYEMMEEIRELRRGGQGERPRRRDVVLSARRQARQGGRDRDRHLRLCRAHGALLGAHIIKVKPPTALARAGRGEEGLREARRSTIATLRRASRHVVQACFNGRRIVVFSGGEAKDLEGHLRRGRARIRDGGAQRLDHRPQHLPAPARGGARHARQDHPASTRARNSSAGRGRAEPLSSLPRRPAHALCRAGRDSVVSPTGSPRSRPRMPTSPA